MKLTNIPPQAWPLATRRQRLQKRLAAMMTALLLAGATVALVRAEDGSSTNSPAWLNKPLSLVDSLNTAVQRNSAILKGQADLEAAYGVVIQTKAIANPTLQLNGRYSATDATEPFPGGFIAATGDQNWNMNLQITQTIYQGGRINSALRTAKLTKDQAILQYQTIVSDTLQDVRVAYYDMLLGEQLITVQEASVKLLTEELDQQKKRFDAGTVPRFNVLRAEVELANARPRLISAKNSFRISKYNLANLLGYNVPKDIWENIPLTLTDKFLDDPYALELPVAIQKALEQRPEIGVVRKGERLRYEDVVSAKSTNKPLFQLFAGYGARNSAYSDNLNHEVDGWLAGAQVTWNLWDGFLTKGKVEQARAQHRRAQEDISDVTRRIELEVRTAYSNFIEAKEVLESQKKVQEQAEEALRLASARSSAGTGTQLDVLSAQTALTEARTTQIQSQHDYSVARVRLERAIGQVIVQKVPTPEPPVNAR